MAEIGRIDPKKIPDAIRPVEPVAPGQGPGDNPRRNSDEGAQSIHKKPGDSYPKGRIVNLISDPNEPTQPETGNTVNRKA